MPSMKMPRDLANEMKSRKTSKVIRETWIVPHAVLLALTVAQTFLQERLRFASTI